jgi:hypothetical protein
MKQGILLRLALGVWLTLLLAPASGQGLHFAVHYPASAFAGPFSGRVIVALSKTSRPEPRFGISKNFTEP